jgi:hypothetical protein
MQNHFDSGNLKQELNEVKQTMDSVVSEVWKLKKQIGDMQFGDPIQDLGNRKIQLVLDVSVVAGVVVGVVLGVFVAQNVEVNVMETQCNPRCLGDSTLWDVFAIFA